MTALEDLATVVELACLTEDRSPKEQAALLREAKRVDAAWNRQTTTNGRLRQWSHLVFPAWPPCTYSDVHDKSCACRTEGVALVPEGGWSRRVALVESTVVNDSVVTREGT